MRDINLNVIQQESEPYKKLEMQKIIFMRFLNDILNRDVSLQLYNLIDGDDQTISAREAVRDIDKLSQIKQSSLLISIQSSISSDDIPIMDMYEYLYPEDQSKLIQFVKSKKYQQLPIQDKLLSLAHEFKGSRNVNSTFFGLPYFAIHLSKEFLVGKIYVDDINLIYSNINEYVKNINDVVYGSGVFVNSEILNILLNIFRSEEARENYAASNSFDFMSRYWDIVNQSSSEQEQELKSILAKFQSDAEEKLIRKFNDINNTSYTYKQIETMYGEKIDEAYLHGLVKLVNAISMTGKYIVLPINPDLLGEFDSYLNTYSINNTYQIFEVGEAEIDSELCKLILCVPDNPVTSENSEMII